MNWHLLSGLAATTWKQLHLNLYHRTLLSSSINQHSDSLPWWKYFAHEPELYWFWVCQDCLMEKSPQFNNSGIPPVFIVHINLQHQHVPSIGMKVKRAIDTVLTITLQGCLGLHTEKKESRTLRTSDYNTQYWNTSLSKETADNKLGLGKSREGSEGGKEFLVLIFVSHHLTLILFGNKLTLPKLSLFCLWS